MRSSQSAESVFILSYVVWVGSKCRKFSAESSKFGLWRMADTLGMSVKSRINSTHFKRVTFGLMEDGGRSREESQSRVSTQHRFKRAKATESPDTMFWFLDMWAWLQNIAFWSKFTAFVFSGDECSRIVFSGYASKFEVKRPSQMFKFEVKHPSQMFTSCL